MKSLEKLAEEYDNQLKKVPKYQRNYYIKYWHKKYDVFSRIYQREKAYEMSNTFLKYYINNQKWK